MPKKRAARGRRGGGNVGRKTAKTEESNVTEVTIDLDTGIEAAVELDESEVADESVGEDNGTENAIDEVPTLNDEVTESVLPEETVKENKDHASETGSEGNEETVAVNELAETDVSNSNNPEDISENTAVDDIIKEDSEDIIKEDSEDIIKEDSDDIIKEDSDDIIKEDSDDIIKEDSDDIIKEDSDDIIKEDSNTECTLVSDAENNEVVEISDEDKLSGKCPDDQEEITAEKCPQLETSEVADQPKEESEDEKVEAGLVKDSIEEECQALEQHGEVSGITVEDSEVVDMDVSSVDKEVEGDQKEVEEVQYIDEEASEDQQSSDLLEIISTEAMITPAESEVQKKDEVGKSIENPIELDENDDGPAGLMKSDLQKGEEIDNSKFEEISEGSIDQDQEELIAEPISDVEITGESFEPKKVSKDGDVNKESTKARYKEAESLEEVFFATENDDMKITAEDKDNDDVSDTSLSNHADANLSLEEISDDDLEPSKKRKKSGATPVKADNSEEKTTPDVDSKSVEKSEVKPNAKSTSVQKRPANDDEENPEGSSNKRLKTAIETKDSEDTPPRSENDVAGDSKKDEKKSQAKESDTFHGRNVPHNRNLSQSSKSGQQESRERAISSRDSAEHKKRYELVSTMSQTEPRQLKGKIVQCNINPVRLVPKQLEVIPENKAVESRLLTKFRKQLPSSIPEKIFLAVTSLHPPQLDNAYSFSMGPVTLSDMDCPKFRLTMRDMVEFSLTFDKHTHGIQKATLANHGTLTSLIGHLKNLELGNRYMVMSVVYKYGVGRTVGVWKATLLFMYEQDIQLESLNLVSDGKVRAKLCLKGVPKDVSKDFIHLLFPEAINVCTGPGQLEERNVILGFSSEKIVEEIISCYDLLIICGSQITISRVDAQETPCLLPDGSEESKPILIEDIQDKKALDKRHIKEDFVKETESCKQQKDLHSQAEDVVIQGSNKVEGNKKDHIAQSGQETSTPSEGVVKTQDQENDDKSTKESKSADSTDSSAEIISASKVVLTESTAAAENTADTSTKMQTVELPVENDKQEETARTSSVDGINSACLDEVGIDKPSDSLLGDVALLETTGEEASKESDQQNDTVPAVPKVSGSLDQMDAENLSDNLVDDAKNSSKTTDEDSSKPETDRQDSRGPEAELLKSTEVSADTFADVTLATDSAEGKIDDKSSKTKEDSKSGKEINTGEKELDKTFEDISDEETVNQSKHGEPDDVVILKHESPEKEVMEIDLTVEESVPSEKVSDDNVKPVTEEKVLHPSTQTKILPDSKVKKAPSEHEEKIVDPKLVMTDGDLEISMEVIDVNEGEQQTEKVIYARTYHQPPAKSRERSSWDARNYKTTPYAQQPWKESHWSDASRSGAYYSSHDTYKQYPPKESSYRVPYYPMPTPDEPAYYKAPVRESTTYRRDSYYSRQKSHRNRSPSPRRDANLHRHSSSHASDHRTSDHWDRRYDSWRPSPYEDSRKLESYSRPPPEYSSKQAYWQSHSTSHHSPPPSHEAPHSSARPRDRYSRGDSREPYDNDRRRKYKKSRSRSLSDMSVSPAELVSPVRKPSSPVRKPSSPVRKPSSPVRKPSSPVRKPSYRRESPKRPAAHTSRSPISVSSRSRSLSPVSKSPSLEYTQPGTGKDKLVKTVKHFLELAKGIKQAHRRQSNRSQSPKSPVLRRSKSPLHSRHRSPSVSSSLLRALRSPRHSDSRRQRSRSPHQLWSRNSKSPSYSKSQRRSRRDRSSSASSHGDDYKRRYKERYVSKREGSYHRSPDHRYESKKPQKTESVNDQSSKSKSGQWSDSKYKSGTNQSWQQSYGSYAVPQSSGSVSASTVYNPTYPPPGPPPQQQSSVYSTSSVPVYPFSSPSQFYSSIPPPYLHVPPPAPIAQSYQAPSYTVYQPPQPYASLQGGTSSAMNVSANNASKTKSWSMGTSAMVFQRVLGPDKKGGKANKSGVISKIEDRERLERPKVAKTERVLTTVQMEKK